VSLANGFVFSYAHDRLAANWEEIKKKTKSVLVRKSNSEGLAHVAIDRLLDETEKFPQSLFQALSFLMAFNASECCVLNTHGNFSKSKASPLRQCVPIAQSQRKPRNFVLSCRQCANIFSVFVSRSESERGENIRARRSMLSVECCGEKFFPKANKNRGKHKNRQNKRNMQMTELNY
jgi:hypothetical protein